MALRSALAEAAALGSALPDRPSPACRLGQDALPPLLQRKDRSQLTPLTRPPMWLHSQTWQCHCPSSGSRDGHMGGLAVRDKHGGVDFGGGRSQPWTSSTWNSGASKRHHLHNHVSGSLQDTSAAHFVGPCSVCGLTVAHRSNGAHPRSPAAAAAHPCSLLIPQRGNDARRCTIRSTGTNTCRVTTWREPRRRRTEKKAAAAHPLKGLELGLRVLS